ncbi:MAG TPA: hypothetical protein PK095_20830, partial [Myxococcota bacterium]|nr:hypothetical protein [Myxococcota bacterium]
RHLDTRYLQPALLSRAPVLADLATSPSPASAPPLYRPALFASVRKSLRIDGWTRLGAQAPGQTLDLGESHWL